MPMSIAQGCRPQLQGKRSLARAVPIKRSAPAVRSRSTRPSRQSQRSSKALSIRCLCSLEREVLEKAQWLPSWPSSSPKNIKLASSMWISVDPAYQPCLDWWVRKCIKATRDGPLYLLEIWRLCLLAFWWATRTMQSFGVGPAKMDSFSSSYRR